MLRRALLVLLVACRSKSADPTSEVTGSLELAGAPLVIERCNAGRETTTFIELVTAKGKLRFESGQLFWTTDRGAVTRGTPLECAKLDRSWGGGQRMDGTSYFRGLLDFRCTSPSGELVGKLNAECGKVTTAERESLDRVHQRKVGSGSN